MLLKLIYSQDWVFECFDSDLNLNLLKINTVPEKHSVFSKNG